MSEKKVESIIRDMFDAFARRDVEKTLSYFTEDAVWVAPEGLQGQGRAEALPNLVGSDCPREKADGRGDWDHGKGE